MRPISHEHVQPKIKSAPPPAPCHSCCSGPASICPPSSRLLRRWHPIVQEVGKGACSYRKQSRFSAEPASICPPSSRLLGRWRPVGQGVGKGSCSYRKQSRISAQTEAGWCSFIYIKHCICCEYQIYI
eukprot:1157727-Pelagomonas_calceolata.AAC.12